MTHIILKVENTSVIINWLNGAPDFSPFSEPTLSVVKNAWDEFLKSGEDLKIINDSELVSELPPSNLVRLKDEISYGNRYPLVQDWYDGLPPRKRAPLQFAIARQDITAMQQYLSNMTVPVDVAAEINELFLLCNIPIVL